MSVVIIAVIAVVSLCVVGVLVSMSQPMAKLSSYTDVIEREARSLIPTASRVLFPLPHMGSIDGKIDVQDRTYEIAGCMFATEGGDGFLHLYRIRGDTKLEIWRRSFEGVMHHESLVMEAIRHVARLESTPNSPQEPTGLSMTDRAAQAAREI